uniref:Transmembrane protein n=1 Tax=Tetradesmus obliquus TaxID=3088 RepID=A0A383W6A7_TETOB|eukprot:jgi/Sobl393_1/10108/SZX79444.1
MSEPTSTLFNPDYTYHYDKISCMKGAYFAHVVFCYFVMLTGVGAFVSRVVPSFKWTHVWFGRGYIISMLWATATSLVIHNSGLPPATLISFVWVMGGMTIAWIIIKFHEARMQHLALAAVARSLAEAPAGPITSSDNSSSSSGTAGKALLDLDARINEEKGRIAASKTFAQRFFSIKALHGMIMFTSWINIVGRIFASNQSGDFTCHTYPVYKPLDTPDIPDSASLDVASLTLLPTHNPDYAKLPWAKLGTAGWGAALSLGPMAGAALVGAAVSFFAARAARKSGRTTPEGLDAGSGKA